ncbi:MAG: glutathione synthase [Betaproteobacteria bacterium]
MKLLFILDPLETLKIKKDTSFAMMSEAQTRGHEIWVCLQSDLVWDQGKISIDATHIEILGEQAQWYQEITSETKTPSDFDSAIMRKDPPFDMEYIYSTYLLELAEAEGLKVFNKPSAIRDHNEKLSIARYPEFIAPTIVTRNLSAIKSFIKDHDQVILKPLDGMGGSSIFRTSESDPNLGVILETLSGVSRESIMAQRFIPEISEGDKRVLLIDGKPAEYALARIPQGQDHRGNLAAGGKGKAMPLTDREREIANTIGPGLASRGLLLVGLDVIGGFLTEVNVTSPTCMREIHEQTGFNVAGMFIDALEQKIQNKN